jgi:hypothetical protein
MDRFALAKAMKEVTRQTDACWWPADIIQHQFAGAPFGSVYVCISPGEQGEFASSNGNRLHLCGAEPGLTADGLTGLQKLFADAGIGRYFVWISPGPDIEMVRRWLARRANPQCKVSCALCSQRAADGDSRCECPNLAQG